MFANGGRSSCIYPSVYAHFGSFQSQYGMLPYLLRTELTALSVSLFLIFVSNVFFLLCNCLICTLVFRFGCLKLHRFSPLSVFGHKKKSNQSVKTNCFNISHYSLLFIV